MATAGTAQLMFDPRLEKPADSPVKQLQNVNQGRLAVARWLYWARGLRSITLSDTMFGEPAWDVLLDLYIQEKSGSRSSVTSACIGSRAPHTTALRHITALCKSGWIARIADETDKRRFWLALTPTALKKLDGYFDTLATSVDFPDCEIQPLG